LRVGISGLAVNNRSGLGRLSRIYLLALALAQPDWELHIYLRCAQDLQLLREECSHGTSCLPGQFIAHYPPVPGLNRLALEEWDLPRQFTPLKLDAYLGCDFNLPPRRVAQREVAILPDLLPFTQPGTVSWRARWLYQRGIRRSAARAQALLCISEHTRKELMLRFPQFTGEARVVYPALSPRLWQLARQEQHADHPPQVHGSLHGFGTSGRFILAVGTLGARKNTELLVRVYSEVVHAGDYRGSLVLVGGDGRYHTAPQPPPLALEMAGPAFGRRQPSAEIYDLGRVSDYDLSQLYQHADLLASLSTEEGFGYPVLEALAHGTPALVTAGSSMTEIAQRGIVTTSLNYADCRNNLVSALGALPLLRQEAAALPPQAYSIERLGQELSAALRAEASPT
jgi:glycosyltransferase involved in cell wall biosynthesis